MKQVLLDMNWLRNDKFNGLYQYSRFLGESISQVPQNEFEWNFYLPGKNIGFFGDHVKYVPHYSYQKFYMPNTERFHIWHITNQISWYRPFNKKTKVVYTIHDLNYLIEEKDNVPRIKRLLKEMQERINRSHHLTAISQFAKQQVLDNLDTGNRPFTVIYNGCSVVDYPGYDSPVYRPLNPYLFSIGSIEKRKNLHVLPALLVNNNYELIIAGNKNGEHAKHINEIAEQMGVSDRVKLIGTISDQDKYWYLKNCMAFFFPSFAEGFGLPVIEAMHFGKPVFLSTETCLPEIAGEHAYYFKHFEPLHMQQVFECGMHDYEKRQPTESIKKFAEKYDWAKAADAYCQVYKQVL